MFRIVKKERLNPTVTKMVIDAPFIAKKAEPGQFIILRALEDSERIPLTIADYDRQGGTVTIIYQIVGGSTMELDTLEEGQTLHDFVGPLVMMKFVCAVTKKYGIKTVVSMNPIMIDGTGMCGGCRLTVGGETKFACVDGPDFDGHLVDFDEAMKRGTMYRDFEQHAREAHCNLMNKEVK